MHANPAIALILLPCSTSLAQTFDVKADWSNGSNPNAPWAYCEGATPLAAITNWQGGCGGGWSVAQPGWADDPCNTSRLPFWYQSNGTETFTNDIEQGDVVVHSTDTSNGVGNGPARLYWTCPVDGVCDVSGALWMGRDIGRANDWNLYYNGALASTGSLASGDPYSRANPMSLDIGTGGPGILLDQPCYAGDVVVLEVVRTTSGGDFVGMNFTIVVTPTPACYADCEHSGGFKPRLDFFDFLCFQNEFVSGNAYADCDASGSLDFFDFLCYQNAFTQGCP